MPVLARLFLLIVAVLAVSTASAKGVTARIVISGGELAEPIVITDPSLLERFSVWSGPRAGRRVQGGEWEADLSRAFMDFRAGVLGEPPTGATRFNVALYQADRYGGDIWDEVFRVDYAITPGSAGGFFYLPRTNMHIIMHGVEDNWLRSTLAWEETVRPLIDEALDTRQ